MMKEILDIRRQDQERLSGLVSVYNLFGKLFLEGVTPEAADTLYNIPEFTDVTGECIAQLSEKGGSHDWSDLAAAQHYQLFGLAVLPYASVFLEADSNLGGEVTRNLASFMDQTGCQASNTDPAEHVGGLLKMLGYLVHAEQSAALNSSLEDISYWREQQYRLMEMFLLPWLPVFAFAVRLEGNQFFTRLCDFTLEVVNDHLLDLSVDISSSSDSLVWPQPPNLLDDPAVGIKDIAHFLVTPAASGIYFGREAVASFARDLKLPRGFGARSQMLANLILSAASFDQVGLLLQRIDASIAGWQEYFRSFVRSFPAIAFAINEGWLPRSENTRLLIKQIENAEQGLEG